MNPAIQTQPEQSAPRSTPSVRQGVGPNLYGTLDHRGIFRILLYVEEVGLSGTLTVADTQNDLATLTLIQGRIVFACAGELEGLEAAKHAFKAAAGSIYRFETTIAERQAKNVNAVLPSELFRLLEPPRNSP